MCVDFGDIEVFNYLFYNIKNLVEFVMIVGIIYEEIKVKVGFVD